MNAQDLKKRSETDWARVDALTDETIDTSDIPPLDESFFANAKLRMPNRKVAVTVTVDADVFAWFEAQDGEVQQRINAALRIYAEAHQK